MARKLASRTTKAAKKSAKTVWPMTLLHKSKCIQILSEVTFLIIKSRYCEKATNIRKKMPLCFDVAIFKSTYVI